MARIQKPPRYQRHKKDRMSTSQIDIIRSLVRGSHVHGATHVAAILATPATITDVEPAVNQVSDLAEEQRDEVSSGANGSEENTVGPTGVSERDITAKSTQSSTEERSKTPMNDASGTGEQSAVQQHSATGSETFGHLVTHLPLVAGLMTLLEVVRVWFTKGACTSLSASPASVPTEIWLRAILRFAIGFILIRYRNVVERCMDHVRLAVAALCLCVLVRDVGAGNVGWMTLSAGLAGSGLICQVGV